MRKSLGCFEGCQSYHTVLRGQRDGSKDLAIMYIYMKVSYDLKDSKMYLSFDLVICSDFT